MVEVQNVQVYSSNLETIVILPIHLFQNFSLFSKKKQIKRPFLFALRNRESIFIQPVFRLFLLFSPSLLMFECVQGK